tara:strand:- start:1948 stop:2298 length:351 start_codon:yes stop_codon:yes gene_type:complete
MAKKKSETRVAFEKMFAAERKKHGGDGGVFTFRGKKYTTDYAKKKETKKKDSKHNFDYSPDSEHMKTHHTHKKTKSKPKKKKFDYSKKFNYSKRKLGGFRDTSENWIESPNLSIDE